MWIVNEPVLAKFWSAATVVFAGATPFAFMMFWTVGLSSQS